MKILFLLALFLSSQAQKPEPGSVSGQIFSREGVPAIRVRVALVEVAEGGAGAALANISQTDEEGRFRLENVPPGRYWVTAGFVDSPSYYPGVRTPGEARSITVAAGQALGDINFPLPRGLRVSGRVKAGPSIAPLHEMYAILRPESRPGADIFAAVMASGTFEFSNVPPGTYTLRLSPGPSGPRITVDDKDLDGFDLSTTPPPTPDLVPPPARTPPGPNSASLYISQSGRGWGAGNREGAITFFRIERSGIRVEEMRLDGSPAISLTPGTYELRTWLQGCDGNCNKLTPPQMECGVSITVAAGQELFVDRIKQGSTCTMQFTRP